MSRYSESVRTLSHDVFFGDLTLSRTLNGLTVSHRMVSSPSVPVPVHIHTDAHFVLVTGGDYVSSATGDAHPRTTLIYNPPGTTHRDHFHEGAGSFCSISLSSTLLSQLLETTRSVPSIRIRQERACGLAWALLMECGRWNASSRLKSESLCLELLAEAYGDATPFRASPPSWLGAACELIQDCPEKTPHVADLAKAAGVHRCTSLAPSAYLLGVLQGTCYARASWNWRPRRYCDLKAHSLRPHWRADSPIRRSSRRPSTACTV